MSGLWLAGFFFAAVLFWFGLPISLRKWGEWRLRDQRNGGSGFGSLGTFLPATCPARKGFASTPCFRPASA